MEDAEIYRELRPIFQDMLSRKDLELTPDLGPADVPGWDSFKQMVIIVAVEKRYGIKFRTRELEDVKTVGDLVRSIRLKIAQGTSL